MPIVNYRHDCLQSRALVDSARSLHARPRRSGQALRSSGGAAVDEHEAGWSHLFVPIVIDQRRRRPDRGSCSAACTATSPRGRSRRCASRARPSRRTCAGQLIDHPVRLDGGLAGVHAAVAVGRELQPLVPGPPRRAARRAALRLHHALPDRRGRGRRRHAQRRRARVCSACGRRCTGSTTPSSGARWSRRCWRGTRTCTSSTSTSPAPACSSGEAERQGKVVVSTELGGGGQVTRRDAPRSHRAASQRAAPPRRAAPARSRRASQLGLEPAVIVRATDDDNYLFAPDAGHWETFVDSGDRVEKGQLVGRIHFIERPDREPTPVHSPSSTASSASCRAIATTDQGDKRARDRPRGRRRRSSA